MPVQKKRFAVLISGRGSNMAALLEAAKVPGFPAEPVLVLSNIVGAAGLDHAAAQGIPTATIPHRDFGRDREAHERAIVAALDEAGAEIVCLAGYMRLLTPYLVRHYAGRMINIHPSLLPAFPGIDIHARALQAGVRLHGCTVHFVTDGMDEGPIIAQAAVPVHAHDTEDMLAARVLTQEHILYPQALTLLATGRARLENDRCVLNAPSPDMALRNPA